MDKKESNLHMTLEGQPIESDVLLAVVGKKLAGDLNVQAWIILAEHPEVVQAMGKDTDLITVLKDTRPYASMSVGQVKAGLSLVPELVKAAKVADELREAARLEYQAAIAPVLVKLENLRSKYVLAPKAVLSEAKFLQQAAMFAKAKK